MKTSVTFKNLDPSDHLKAYVGDKLNKFDKYLYSAAEASVVLAVEKHRHIAEINITGDRMTIHGKEETDDMYSAIDMVLDKLESQIKKSKQKQRKHRGPKTRGRGADTGPIDTGYAATTGQIRVESIEYKPMDVEEAVMQMALIDDHFMVFTNARTDRVNVLYRRSDGDFGLIQPNG
jgi:putative sigma-54 modulation protein